jgi:hypothetical protein
LAGDVTGGVLIVAGVRYLLVRQASAKETSTQSTLHADPAHDEAASNDPLF